MAHYHVISGQRGYMPDRNEVSKTRKEAEANAKWWVGSIREDGGRIRGSARSGRYDVLNPEQVGIEYIEISECDFEDCLKDMENE